MNDGMDIRYDDFRLLESYFFSLAFIIFPISQRPGKRKKEKEEIIMGKRFPSLQIATALILIVSLCLPASSARATSPVDYTAWNDQGIVYTAPSGNAYYPSVLYDADGFGAHSPLFKMWYSDGNGNVYLVTSTTGLSWGTPAALTGLSGGGELPHHVQVLYNAECFGASPCSGSTAKYRIWYWGQKGNYTIDVLLTAESADGLAWTNAQSLTQSATSPLITGISTDWNYGTYGPVYLFYQASATNTGTNPWSYSYIMYYDAATGSSEVTGLAYSADGVFWTRYGTTPVLDKGAGDAWDCDDASYGTVYHDEAGFHYWYSGAGTPDGSGGCLDTPLVKGIGYAGSTDGLSWTKSSQPIFHVSQGVSYRSQRVYTPAVVDDGSGTLKMYYTAVGGDGIKKIALALLTVPVNHPPTIDQTDPVAVTMSENGSPHPFSLSLSATDPDGDALTWTISSPASNGTANTTAGTGTSNSIQYSPNPNYAGSDSFIVQVSDGRGGVDTVTVNVTILYVYYFPLVFR